LGKIGVQAGPTLRVGEDFDLRQFSAWDFGAIPHVWPADLVSREKSALARSRESPFPPVRDPSVPNLDA